ncbi:hypothetical protein IC617_08735 [Neiella sp. HB171785]|uniref:Uncharacterized protein n=1 Tax=Neiella litorisoli TaxID=2771431 RepID=A0A8J6QU75_9GAMM|nr:hypothetical protein [Neiella litorisoli]MBD1389512.1 hypothetical protein [Neiella litorisoli]
MPRNPYDQELLEFMLSRGDELLRYTILNAEQFLASLRAMSDLTSCSAERSRKLEELIRTHFVDPKDITRLLNNRRSWRRSKRGQRPKLVAVTVQTKERIAALVDLFGYDSESDLLVELLNAVGMDPETLSDNTIAGVQVCVPVVLRDERTADQLVATLKNQLPSPYCDLLG